MPPADMTPTRPDSITPQGARRGSARGSAWRTLPKPRRLQRVWGVAALVGLGMFVAGLLGSTIPGAFGSDAPAPPAVGLLVIWGGVLAAVGWVVWALWSQYLDTAKSYGGGTLRLRAKFTLWAMGLIGLGAILLLGGIVPFFVFDDEALAAMGGAADVLANVFGVLMAAGAAAIVILFAGSAIAGGVALGGPKWWWVGVVFDIGFAATVFGMVQGLAAWKLGGAMIVALAIAGYGAALAVGVRARRRAALEALERRAALERRD